MAIKSNGTLWSWGFNTYGELGNGTNGGYTHTNVPGQVGTETSWQSVAAGNDFTVALQEDGSLWAWGANHRGQLGDGTNTNSNIPVPIESGTTWLSVTAGDYFALAIKSDGTLWSWGYNGYGVLGTGDYTNTNAPVQVGLDTNWFSISAGSNHVLAIKSDDSLWAWGYNQSGALGNGTTTATTAPSQIGTETNWQIVKAGNNNSFAIKTDGSSWAWGYNYSGQLGIGSTEYRSLVPVQIEVGTLWTTVAAGNAHGIGVQDDSTLWVWGANSDGQLGDGTSWSTIPLLLSAGQVFAVSPSFTGNGSIDPAAVQDVILGGRGQFTLTPDPSNFIVDVTGTCSTGELVDNGDGSWQYTTGTVMSDCTVIVNFADTATLTYTSGANGSITGNVLQSVAYGSDATAVTAVPDAGYVFANWSDGVTTATRTDTNVMATISVTANFSTIAVLQYTASANGNIAGDVSQTVVYGGDGSSVIAVADFGHQFTGWSDGVLTPIRADTNVTANIFVTANFAADTLTLTYTAEANGSIVGDASQTVAFGEDGTVVTAQSAAGYHFVTWDDGVTDAARTETSVSADISVVAKFAGNTYMLTSAVPGGHGTIDPAGEQTVNHGDIKQFVLTPDAGYRIDSVIGGCGGILSGSTFTTYAVSASCSVNAVFTLNQYTLSVVFAGSGSGSVSSDPLGIDTCKANCSADFASVDVVTLTATADEGSSFTGWSGDGCFGTGDCTVTMDQAREITATFGNGFPWTMFMPAITGMHP